jgi:zinc transport system substrate-binding protein
VKNKFVYGFVSLLLCCTLVGCQLSQKQTSQKSNEQTEETTAPSKLQVVTTVFPYYDFVRQIAGDLVEVSLIVPAGMDTHSFEPTPKDLIQMGEADLLIYNGGENEQWVNRVLESSSNSKLLADEMMQHVDTLLEEHVEGMETEQESDGDEEETDEHIWTSPVNAMRIVEQIAQDLSQADPEHATVYQARKEQYTKKLQKLDQKIRRVVSGAKQRYLAFGDRFPLRYFVEEYGLEYTAAFAGCSSDTEPSAATITYLTTQVKKRHLPVVFKIELTSDRVANAIAEAASTKEHPVIVETFYTCHNVTKQQFDEGATYVSLMKHNLTVLKKALENE